MKSHIVGETQEGGMFVEYDVEKATRIAEMRPDERIVEDYDAIASDYAWAGSGLAYALDALAEKDRELELLEAILRSTVIGVLLDAKEKATEKAIHGEIVQDAGYAEAVEARDKAKLLVALWKSAAKSVQLKADMLTSKGAHLRKELDSAV